MNFDLDELFSCFFFFLFFPVLGAENTSMAMGTDYHRPNFFSSAHTCSNLRYDFDHFQQRLRSDGMGTISQGNQSTGSR